MREVWARARFALLWLSLALLGCGQGSEAERVLLPVSVGGAACEPATTNLGYEVQLSVARLVARDFTFSVAGEVHSSLARGKAARAHTASLRALLWPAARAHPGHLQGGEVTGELLGRFVLNLYGEVAQLLGSATLLSGHYESASFTLSRATAEDALAGSDPLLGHTAELLGVARKDGGETRFIALIDSPDDRAITGVPFDMRVEGTNASSLRLRLLLRDPEEHDTLFDDIDFAALAARSDGTIELRSGVNTAAYEQLRRTLQTHDHFSIEHGE